MIDPDTRSRLKVIERLAVVDGRDMFENMDRARLLLTEDRMREIQIQTLTTAMAALSEQPTQLIVNQGGGTNCAADAHRGAIAFLEFLINTLEKRS